MAHMLSSYSAQAYLWHVGSSSLTRDRTWAPALGAWSLSHWTTRQVPVSAFFAPVGIIT